MISLFRSSVRLHADVLLAFQASENSAQPVPLRGPGYRARMPMQTSLGVETAALRYVEASLTEAQSRRFLEMRERPGVFTTLQQLPERHGRGRLAVNPAIAIFISVSSQIVE